MAAAFGLDSLGKGGGDIIRSLLEWLTLWVYTSLLWMQIWRPFYFSAPYHVKVWQSQYVFCFLVVHVVQRNADDVTLQCTTDQIQIIWRIGDQPPFEAASYGGNGSFITDIINTTVTECTTIVCTGKPDPFDRQIPESDVLLLCPLEGLFGLF